jgi:hypothetical protein
MRQNFPDNRNWKHSLSIECWWPRSSSFTGKSDVLRRSNEFLTFHGNSAKVELILHRHDLHGHRIGSYTLDSDLIYIDQDFHYPCTICGQVSPSSWQCGILCLLAILRKSSDVLPWVAWTTMMQFAGLCLVTAWHRYRHMKIANSKGASFGQDDVFRAQARSVQLPQAELVRRVVHLVPDSWICVWVHACGEGETLLRSLSAMIVRWLLRGQSGRLLRKRQEHQPNPWKRCENWLEWAANILWRWFHR